MTRVVAVELRAMVAEYNANMAKAAQATRTVGTEAEKLTQQRQAFQLLGRSMVAAGGLMAAGIGVAVKRFADFDQAMSNVAATGQDARNSLQALRDAAIEAGAKTVFSATESANAIEEMAKAGVDAKDILGGGLKGALDLAAAGGLGVADAAGIAATALKTFNLEGSDMSHVADLLAAGAGKAMGDVSDLSMALRQGGQVAAATGLSIEETTAALSAFASQGLLGSDAGTSLKTMLQRLTPQTKEAQKQFEALGISAYDANGQFVGLSDFAGQLQTAMADLTPEARNAAMSVLFGSDAVRAANVLYKEGESGIRGWIKAVDDQGYAAETASTRLDNLKGDWEALTGAVDSALITMGSAADGPLRGFVQGITGMVDVFNDLPDVAQQAAFWVGAIGSAATIAGGAYFLAVPKIAEFNEAVSTLGPAAQKTAGRLSTLAKVGSGALAGLAIGTVALEALSAALDSVGLSSEEMANRIGTASDAIDVFQAAITKSDMFGRWSKDAELATYQLENLGDILDKITKGETVGIEGASAIKSVGEIGKTLAEMDLSRASRQFALLAEQAGLTEAQQRKLLDQMPEFKASLTEEATSLDVAANNANLLQLALTGTVGPAADAAVAQKEAAEQAKGLQEASEDAAKELDNMKAALDGVADSAMSMGDAKDDAIGAINAMRDAADHEKASLKGTNDESIRFRDSLRDVEKSHRDSAAAILENDGTLKDARKEWQRGRDAVLDQLEAMGLSRGEAKKWADANLGSSKEVKGALADVQEAYRKTKKAAEAVPDSVTPEIALSGYEAAMDKIRRFREVIRDTNGSVVEVRVGTKVAKAGGGAVAGPGTGTSDSIPALLSNGEHVITAEEVRRAGGQSAVYAARAALMAGGPLRFASGGAVTSDSAARAVREAEREVREARADYEDAKAASKRAKSKKAKERAQKAERDALAELQDAKRDLQAAKDDALALRRSFRMDLREWNTGQRRGENFEAGMSGNGLSLVDQLLDIAVQTGGKSGDRLRERARKSEAAYLKLEDAAEKAASRVDTAAGKLTDLRNAAASMAQGVANAVRGWFNLGKLGESSTSEVLKTRAKRESVTVGGRTYSWEGVESYTETKTTNPTAGSILAGTQAAEARIKGFADKLKRLAGMGLNAKLLEEIALLGVANGEPIADALLGATSKQISDLNKSYEGIGKYSDLAGSTVADANFGSLIRLAERQLNDAERHAADIQKKLEAETTRVIKAITDALTKGMKKASGGPIVGPGTGTSDDVPIWASNGEHMIPAWEVSAAGGHDRVFAWRRAMVSGRAPGFAKGGPVLVPTGSQFGGAGAPVVIRELVVKDQDGALIGRMRVEADGVIGARERREVAGMRAEVAEW